MEKLNIRAVKERKREESLLLHHLVHPPHSKPPDFLSRSNPLLDMLPLCSSTLTRRLVPPVVRRRPPVCSGIMEPMSGMINPPEDAGRKHRSVSGGRGG